MEAGYNSHPNRLGTESHYGGDNLFNQSRPYMVSSPSYYYTSPPPVTPRPKGDTRPYMVSSPSYFYVSPPPVTPRPKGDTSSHMSELYTEDSLVRRLSLLTNALNQGKPIRVEDLMSLRSDNEVSIFQLMIKYIFKYFIFKILYGILYRIQNYYISIIINYNYYNSNYRVIQK